jgi:ABC-type multidrug transport system fused ATPase/permease subunit
MIQESNPLKIKGIIEFRNVEMKYKPDLKPALKNLSFKIEVG